MSNGVGKNPTLSPCLAYGYFVKITHYTHFYTHFVKTTPTLFYTDTPKKSK